MILFKDLTSGSIVYSLIKGDDLEYSEGTIVNVSQPRVNMPPIGQMPTQNIGASLQVVDVTYTLGGKNYTKAVDLVSSSFSTDDTGFPTLVATEKEPIIRELQATLKQSENFLQDIEKNEKRVEQSKELIAKLDNAYHEKREMENRLSKLEESQTETNKLLKDILEKLGRKDK